jgi:hypothetical protein
MAMITVGAPPVVMPRNQSADAACGAGVKEAKDRFKWWAMMPDRNAGSGTQRQSSGDEQGCGGGRRTSADASGLMIEMPGDGQEVSRRI